MIYALIPRRRSRGGCYAIVSRGSVGDSTGGRSIDVLEVALLVAVFVGGELAGLDSRDVRSDRGLHLPADVAELLRERGGPLAEADRVVDHEHLPVAVRPGTDPDRRDI